MMEFLTVLAVGALLVVCLLVMAAGMAVRRVRRSRLVTFGTQAVADGVLALTAAPLRPPPNRSAALQAPPLSPEQRPLPQRGTHAQRSGVPPRPTPNRSAALQALRISREQRLLRQRVTDAQRSGVHLGDVPAVLPRLEAEGRRLCAGLSQLVGSTATGHELRVEADHHLATLA